MKFALFTIALLTSAAAHASNCQVAGVSQDAWNDGGPVVVLTCAGDHIYSVSSYDVATALGQPRTNLKALNAAAAVMTAGPQQLAFLKAVDKSLPEQTIGSAKPALTLYGSNDDAHTAAKSESTTDVAQK